MQNLSRDTVPWRSSHTCINHMSSTCDHWPVIFYGDENFTASSGNSSVGFSRAIIACKVVAGILCKENNLQLSLIMAV